MEFTQLKTIRDGLRTILNKSGNPAPIFVIVDNLKMFDESINFMKWDDDNQILWVFQRTENILRNVGEQARIQLIATSYEHIQYVGTRFTGNELSTYVKNIPGLELTDEQVLNIRQYLAPTLEEFEKSIRTEAQIEALKVQDKFIEQQMALDHSVKPKV